MDEKELMISDWVRTTVNDTPHNVKVIGIDVPDYDETFYLVRVSDGRCDWHCELYEIEPIPITPEILEIMGFEPAQNLYVLKSKNKTYPHMFFIEYNLVNKCLFINDGLIPRPIAFLHELQHALRLCGIEKDIII